jgi:hypothetical protein
MARPDHPFVHQDSICSAGYDFADRIAHIRQPLNRPNRDAVVHRNNYRFAGIAVDYSL